MITSGVFLGPRRCPICQEPGHVCGDNHMRRGPVDNTVTGGVDSMSQPQELREYTYTINNQVTTALLTPEMAERLGAKPTGDSEEERTGGYDSSQNAAVYGTTRMSGGSALTPDRGGIVGGDATEPNREQQKGIVDGRTASMRAGTDLEDNAKSKSTTSGGDDDSDSDTSTTTPTAFTKARRAARDK